MIIDLPDERRAAKTWLSADDRDVTCGRVYQDSWGKPACQRHGAMNRVDQYRRIYRCSDCGVGAEMIVDPEPGTPEYWRWAQGRPGDRAVVEHCAWCGGKPQAEFHPDGGPEHRVHPELWKNAPTPDPELEAT